MMNVMEVKEVKKMNRSNRRAFTLIELLTVIAITAILMTLIVVPLIQSFNLTRAAQGWAQAQDKARTLTERIAREINDSQSVRDNTGDRGRLDIVVPSAFGGPLPGYDTSHLWSRISIFNAKIDLVKPFEGNPLNQFGGAFVNPVTNHGDPTLQVPRGQINLPSSPGLTIVRYFVGLRDPLRPSGANYAGYNEPYTGLLQTRNSNRDNLYVLYRAEVQPYVWNQAQGKFVVNRRFFYDLSENGPGQSGPFYDDPTFFDPTIPYPNSQIGDPTKAEMVQNWMSVAQIQTEVDHFDMIQPVYDLKTRQVQFNAGAPRVLTLIQFTPTHIGTEPAEGQMAVRPGQETDAPTRLAPDVWMTKYLGWSNAVVSFTPSGFVSGNEYEVGLLDSATPGYDVWRWAPALGDDLNPVASSTPISYKLLDDYYYRDSLKNGIRASLSRAMASANSFDMSSGRGNWLGDVAMRSAFRPFFADANRGRVNVSYGIDEIGTVDSNAPFMPIALPDPVNNAFNLPGNVTWPNNTPALSPFNDGNLLAGVFSDPQYSSINKRFNKLWHDYPNLHENLQRFIDLRVTPNSDGAPSPLNPDPTLGFAQAYIVPGSEQVFGPDQNPGPNYGNPVRYWRTTHNPGPNQYRINYTDLPEPDYTLLGLTPPPLNYTATDLTSAVFQPRYKAGYIQLNSDPNVPLPNNNLALANGQPILVYYRFQFSRPSDALIVNYDSRQLLTVQMTIRDYPQSNLPNPQTVTLHSTAQVRNFLR